jgi:hypothetical protein
MRVTNVISLGYPLPLTVATVNSVQTLKGKLANEVAFQYRVDAEQCMCPAVHHGFCHGLCHRTIGSATILHHSRTAQCVQYGG